jgi:hypothetical protein
MDLDDPHREGRRSRLHTVAWFFLTAALAWFLSRELFGRPVGDDGRSVVWLLMAASFAGGAMLVGAKLALSRPGGRPSLRDMVLMLLGPPFGMLFLLYGWNSLGRGPEQRFIAPVIALTPDPDDPELTYVETLGPDGESERLHLETSAANAFRRGECMEVRFRDGALGLPVETGRESVACPAANGQPAPDGPLFTARESGQWRWKLPLANEGPGYEQWMLAMQSLALERPDDVDGRTIGFEVRLEPDNRVSAVRAVGGAMPEATADRLAATLVGRTDVLIRPDDLPKAVPLWVAVPARVTFNIRD